MHQSHYELVRLERDLRLRAHRSRPLSPSRSRPDLDALRRRLPRRRSRPLMSAHEYLELEFTVEDRR